MPKSGITPPSADAILHAAEASLATALAAIDNDGRQSYVSPAFCAMVGWSADELIGQQAPFVYWPAEELEAIQAAFAQTVEGRAPGGGFELCFQRRHGDRFFVEVAIAPLIAHGERLGWLASLVEISERKQLAAERAEREHQERAHRLADAERRRLNEILDHMPAGVMIADAATGATIYANRQAQQIFGGPIPEAQAADEYSTTFTGWRPDGQPLASDEFPLVRAVHGETVLAQEVQFRRPSGEIAIVRANASPIRDEHGRVVAAVTAYYDVTAQVTLERAIVESEQRFRTLAEATSTIVWQTGPDGRIIEPSPSWTAFTGQTKDAWTPGAGLDAMHPDDLDRIRRAWAEAIATRAPFEIECRVRRHDGRFVPMSVRATPVLGDDGEVREWIGSNTDITDRLALLESERAARRDAERASAEAEAANRSKDVFLAMLGHELRNPLAPILTALELMRLRGSEVALKERSIIERQVEHLVRLVDDLLDVSRITRGKIDLERRPIEIAEVIAKAIEMASTALEQHRHHLHVAVEPAGLCVDGDRGRLAQVFCNLITNAAKYTRPGGNIAVSASREAGAIAVRVKDDGEGIDAQLLPRIFDLFEQGEQTIDRAQGGLGIGLTIVKTLVELHGGSVEAHSDGKGSGSEFAVRLPASTGAPGAAAVQAAVAPAGEPRALRVLLVDDNHDAVMLLSEALTTLGYETRVAHDGPSALAAAAEFRPGVAMLDIGLPVMDGYELAELLREQAAEIRLVAMTGYGQESDRRRARDAGFEHHLVKPLSLDRVAVLLDGLARSSRAAGR